jgi:transcriptional regulator with XRE-family HTH domain
MAANIKAAREAREMTQRELASLVNDVDTLAVSRWERGVSRPTDANLHALAEALGVDVAWFFAEHPEVTADA